MKKNNNDFLKENVKRALNKMNETIKFYEVKNILLKRLEKVSLENFNMEDFNPLILEMQRLKYEGFDNKHISIILTEVITDDTTLDIDKVEFKWNGLILKNIIISFNKCMKIDLEIKENEIINETHYLHEEDIGKYKNYENFYSMDLGIIRVKLNNALKEIFND
jgi:hypothetical protein